MKIVYTPQAKEDLTEIKNYIGKELLNPSAASNIIEKILRSAHNLSTHPHLGISLQEKVGRETKYRCLFSGNYGIFYFENQNRLIISRILDLRTDYIRIIFNH